MATSNVNSIESYYENPEVINSAAIKIAAELINNRGGDIEAVLIDRVCSDTNKKLEKLAFLGGIKMLISNEIFESMPENLEELINSANQGGYDVEILEI